MTVTTPRQSLVLAVHPNSAGLGYVVFEGPFAPFDWGNMRPKRDKNAKCLRKVERLIDRLQPEVLVLEAFENQPGVVRDRVARLRKALIAMAFDKGIEVAVYTRADVRGCFATVGAKTREEIAQAVARQVPAFAHRLPKQRRVWETEHPRMALFAAAALVLTHYALDAKRFLEAL